MNNLLSEDDGRFWAFL